MAFRLKHWGGVALAGCALVAVLKLPPEIFVPRGDGEAPLTEEVRYRALLADVNRSREVLSRLRWSDSLSGELVRTATDGWAVGVEGGSVSAGALERFTANVEREIMAIPHRRDDVLLGVFVQSGAVGEHPDVEGIPRIGWHWPEYYMGRREGVPYCFTLRPITGTVDDTDLSWTAWSPFGNRAASEVHRGNTLGPCYWVGELGLPSAAMTRWLKGGGHLFGAEPPDRASRPEMNPLFRRRGPFGMRMLYWGSAMPVEECLAGIAEACAGIFSAPLDVTSANRARRERDPTPLLETDLLGRWAGMEGGFESWHWILGDLQTEFGTERLKAFWTADSDPLTAFHDAFGVDAGEWMAAWTTRNLGTSPPGPAPTRTAFFGGFLVLLLGAGLAMGSAHKRSVSS